MNDKMTKIMPVVVAVLVVVLIFLVKKGKERGIKFPAYPVFEDSACFVVGAGEEAVLPAEIITLVEAELLIKPGKQREWIKKAQRYRRAYGKKKAAELLPEAPVNLDEETKEKLTTALQEIAVKGDKEEREQAEYLLRFL